MLMSLGLVTLSLGLGVALKTVEKYSLKSLGLLTLSIVGTGLAIAGVGLAAIPIAATMILKGSLAMVVMGASLIVYGIGLGKIVTATEKLTLKQVGIITAAIAGTGLAVAGVGLAAIPIGIGSLSLLLIGGVLTILGLSLKKWQEFDSKKSIDNIKIAVNGLKDVFGLNAHDGESNTEKLKSIGGGILDMGIALLSGGKALINMATLMIVVGMSDIIRLELKPWENYDPSKAIGSIDKAINGLKRVFGMNKTEDVEEEKKGLLSRLKDGAKNILNAGSTMLQMGAQFVQLGHIATACGIMDIIKCALEKWDSYNSSKALSSIQKTIGGLKSLLLTTSMEDMNIDSYLNFSMKFKQGTNNISSVNKDMALINRNLSKFATNIGRIPFKETIDTINSVNVGKAGVMISLFNSFGKLKNRTLFSDFDRSVDKFARACRDIIEEMQNPHEIEVTETPVETSGETPSINQTSTTEKGVNIVNTQQIAEAIANALKNLNIRVNPNSLDINLIAEGGSGKTVKLTLLD